MKITIGSLKSSKNGRSRKIRSLSARGLSFSSSSVTYLLSFISFRIFFAQFERMVGAYVSGTPNVIRIQQTPDRINWIQ